MAVIDLDNLIEIKPKPIRKWREMLAFSLGPFILWGAPIHKIVQGSIYQESHQPPTEIIPWIKFLLKISPSPLVLATTILTLILLPLALYFNYVLAEAIGHFIWTGLIKGKLQWAQLQDILTLYQVLPIVLPVDYLWIFGFKFKPILESLGNIPNLEGYIRKKKSWSQRIFNWTWLRLLLIYGLIACIHTISVYLFKAGKKQAFFDTDNLGLMRIWTGYSTDVLYTLVFPTYLTLCWAIKAKYKAINRGISNMVTDGAIVDIGKLTAIKNEFKDTANAGVRINKIFRGFLSWSVFVLGLGIVGDLSYIAMTLALVAIERKEDGTVVGVIWSVISTIMEALGWVNLDEENGIETIGPSEDRVRSLFLQLILIGLKATLLIITRQRIKSANDEAQLVFSSLNDFVSEQKATEGIPRDVYHSFRTLRFYMFSRMSRPDTSLLDVANVNVIPFVRLSFMKKY